MSDFKVGDRVMHKRSEALGVVIQTQDISGLPPYQVQYDDGKTYWNDARNLELSQVPPVRSWVLSTAGELINGQRAKDYGDAAENFQRIADLWQPILGVQPTPAQVALCLTQLKVARIITSPAHTDSWVDAAGYIALGAETALKDKP